VSYARIARLITEIRKYVVFIGSNDYIAEEKSRKRS